jgi:hypothetical protein
MSSLRREAMTAGKQADARVTRVEELATYLREEAGAETHVLIGPALIYGDEQLGLMVVVGSPGGLGRIIGVDLGFCEADSKDGAICAAADTMLWRRKPAGITQREGDACRQELIRVLRRSFRHVEAHKDDLALAEAYLRWFPGPEARELVAAIRAEEAAE